MKKTAKLADQSAAIQLTDALDPLEVDQLHEWADLSGMDWTGDDHGIYILDERGEEGMIVAVPEEWIISRSDGSFSVETNDVFMSRDHVKTIWEN